jgi:NDP-sugar pyrophosphorylase family protein
VKALLLAAGEGTRLGPLTADRPKPMVEIGGEPGVAHALRWLRRQGVTDVAINLHHHPDVLRQFVGDGSRFGLAVTCSFEPEILGTSGALGPLRDFFRAEDAFLVLYGDVLTDLDLRPVGRAHAASGADATIVLCRVDDPTRAGLVAFDGHFRITRLLEKPAASDVFSDWANAGIYCCGPAVLRYVSAQGPQDFARDLFPAMLRDGRHLLASPTTARVIDFGAPERLEAARAAVRRGALGRETAGQPC